VTDTPALDVQDLSKRYGEVLAVDRLSFRMPRGTVWGLLGGNGAGKTTTIAMLLGLLVPSSGRILALGHDMASDRFAALARMNFSSPYVSLPHRLSVRENLRLAAQFVQPGPQLASVLRPVSASRAALARVDELTERFGLHDKLDELAGYLSHGEQRRLEIAVALAARPRLLLLDEPTQGMSHIDTQDTAALIRSLAGDLSILLIEHDVELVMNLSDHVVVMHQGAKLAEGTPQAVRANPAVQAAYFGEHHDAAAH